MVTQAVIGLITLVVVVLIITALGPTILTQTDTRSCDNTIGDNVTGCALENVSATGGTMFSLIELLYPIIGVIIVITGGFLLSKRL